MGEPASSVSRDGPVEFVHRSWSADSSQLRPLRTELQGWLAPFFMPGDTEDDLVLAVSEAAANSVEHAYIPRTAHDVVELTLWTEPHAVCIEIMDHGVWLSPSDEPGGRGRGIERMRRLVAFMLIHHDERGTRVFFRQPLPDARLRELEAGWR